jgi:hypothetical protein
VRPPKLAIRTVIGGLIAAAILGVGAVSASAAPNPGFGLGGAPVPFYKYHSNTNTLSATGNSATNPGPGFNWPFEQTADGPQTSNVPILAWVGEDVRLVACDDDINPNPLNGPIVFQQASFNTNLWTGDQAYGATPTFDGSQSTNLYLTNTGGSSFFYPDGIDNIFHGCVAANISSLHAGLDEVTLNVYSQIVLGGALDPIPTYSKQFVVIWMTAKAPVLTESSLSSLEFPTQADGTASTATSLGSTTGQLSDPTGTGNATSFLGDASTPGTFASLDQWKADESCPGSHPWDCQGVVNNTPTANNGLVNIRVKGTFPIEDQPPATTNESYFQPVTGTAPGTVGTVTLPDDWVKLANLMATSSTQNTANNINPTGGQLWDIHGGPTNPAGHAGPSTGICGNDSGPFLQTTDAVDDCVISNNGQNGNPYVFSRVFGDVTGSAGIGTVGPYDPLASDFTLLSDGRLNSDDAPMPALPITLSIAGNSGNPGDIGGIGGLYGVSKYMVYSHDFNLGSASPTNGTPVPVTSTGTANLYNPFYVSYIPSTLRPINEASGVSGVYEFGIPGGSGTDFPGFSLGQTDPYPYWEALNASTTDAGGTNPCFREFSEADDIQNGADSDDYYNQPYYPTQLTVYTDERGEAFVDYNPGTGFYMNGFTPDANNACDLQSLFGKPIGTSAITAQVNYPYEAVPYVPPASNTLTKTVLSQWEKTLTVYPKGNLSGGAGGANVSIVVAHAQDVNGSAFVGETVCFTTSPAEGLVVDNVSFTPTGGTLIDLSGVTGVKTPKGVSSNYTCALTNQEGNAAVEVSGSGSPAVDVTAFFVDEDLYRDVMIPALGQTTTVTSTTPPTVLPASKIVLSSGSAGDSGSASTNASSSTPAAQQPAAQTPVAVKPLTVGKTANSCKVNSFHVFAKRGYAKVKVTCTSSKTAHLVMRAYRKNGKLMHTYKRTIRTGKVVTIRLHLKKVKHLKLAVR